MISKGRHWLHVDTLLNGCLLVVSWTHVLLAPYTKVEESFSIQAIHDILAHGVRPDAVVQYDHRVFPGAVPRSFIGPLLLSFLSYPILLAFQTFDLIRSSADTVLFVRLILATLSTSSLIFFSYAAPISNHHVSHHRRAFIIITLLQFQLLFWAGRTTPNGIVSPFVILALALIFSKHQSAQNSRYTYGLALLTACQVIARMEIAGLVIPAAFSGVFLSKLSIPRQLHKIVKVGLISSLLAIASTVLVDTYFWGRRFAVWNPSRPSSSSSQDDKLGFLWPELEAILFNVVEGKSSEWGTSPWHSYLTSHLPRLLSFSTALCLLGIASDLRSPVGSNLSKIVMILAHISILSLLGHKETRFISYLTPLLNLFSAKAAVILWHNSRTSKMLGRFVVIFTLSATALVTTVSLRASVGNYPGGEAMQKLHALVRQPGVTIHIDVHPAMTGVNLFQSVHLSRPYSALGIDMLPSVLAQHDRPNLNWTYDKTEDLTKSDLDQWQRFTHLVSDDSQCHLGPDHFTLLYPQAFTEFDGVSIKRPPLWFVSLLEAPSICYDSGILAWTCFDALIPLQYGWRDAVWLCERRKGTSSQYR